jgi:hypothetical protein
MAYNKDMAALQDIEVSGVPGVEPRQSERFPMRCPVWVCCLVTERSVTARGLDISARGLALVTDEAFALGAVVQVALPNCGLSAMARVRNCEWRNVGWRVGVELLGSLA